MIPLLWRYLLSQYLKVFIFCVLAFVAILITMRLEEIAYFATLGAEMKLIAWFALQQIPYILPLAFPVAALISALLLVQSLSQRYELTAMRACGFALRDIFAPLLFAALFLSALNFYFVSELSTSSHLQAGLIKNQLRAVNPLQLLHNKHIMRMRGFYFDTLGSSQVGEFAEDIVFLSPNRQHDRLNLLVAKKIEAISTSFNGNYVTLLTSRASKEREGFEDLMMENMQESRIAIKDFSQLLEKKIVGINNDHLRLPLLLTRLEEAKNSLREVRQLTPENTENLKQAKHAYRQCCSEIFRRVSVAVAVFSFTLLGLAFGIHNSRQRSHRGVFYVIGLVALFLVSFFMAKSFDYDLTFAAILYLVPHLIVVSLSLWILNRVAHGIER